MKYLIPILTLLITCSVPDLFCQSSDTEIRDITISQEGNNLVTSYTIVTEKKTMEYFFTIEIKDSKGKTISKPFASNADSNVLAYPGVNKNTWLFEKDGIILNEEIFVTITIQPNVSVPLGSHIIKSAIYPGWGNYRLGNSNFYFTYGLAGWGFMAGSVLLNKSAADNYENYKNTTDYFTGEDYYSKAVNQNNLSYVCFGIGAAIWIANLTGVINKQRKVQKDITQSEYYYNYSKQIISKNSNKIYFDNRPEWKKLMDEGDISFRNQNYAEAKSKYQQANTLNPDNKEITARLKETEAELEKIRQAEEEYKKIIASADSLFNLKDYAKAINFYLAAQVKQPKINYPRQQIEECNKRIEEIKKLDEYNKIIAEADQFFTKKQYDDAKSFYSKALKILPDKEYPQNQLYKIDDIETEIEYKTYIASGKDEMRKGNYGNAKYFFKSALEIKPNSSEAYNLFSQTQSKMAEQEQARLNKEYKNNIAIADAAFDNKEYDKAKDYYQKASRTKPSETYPKSRISTINDYLEKKGIVVKVIKLTKTPDGTYKIPCKVNGLELDFIFDTGASIVSLSLTEARYMYKHGYLIDSDFIGTEYFSTADGSITEGMVIKIRKLEFEGMVLTDIDATIINNLNAPILLGQSALSKLGKIQIDYDKNTLTILK